MNAKQHSTPYLDLIDTIRRMPETVPAPEEIVEMITSLAKDYPGFKKAEYEMGSHSLKGNHVLTAEFNSTVFIQYSESFTGALCILNERMLRYFKAGIANLDNPATYKLIPDSREAFPEVA